MNERYLWASEGRFWSSRNRDRVEQGLKVLIAEDDASSRMILKKGVEKFGHECRVAEDGLKLLRKLPVSSV